jgi:hypothetical protein
MVISSIACQNTACASGDAASAARFNRSSRSSVIDDNPIRADVCIAKFLGALAAGYVAQEIFAAFQDIHLGVGGPNGKCQKHGD